MRKSITRVLSEAMAATQFMPPFPAKHGEDGSVGVTFTLGASTTAYVKGRNKDKDRVEVNSITLTVTPKEDGTFSLSVKTDGKTTPFRCRRERPFAWDDIYTVKDIAEELPQVIRESVATPLRNAIALAPTHLF